MEIQLPDLTKVRELVDEINDLALEYSDLKYDLEIKEAEIVKEATLNPAWLQNGKSPSQEFIKNSWKILGFDGELKDLRKKVYDIETKLKNKERLLRLFDIIIDLWRTQSANLRTTEGYI